MTLINQLASNWWAWMGPMLWQVSLLIIIISAIDLSIRKWAWPQVRYALWLLVILKLLIPPSWSLPSGVISRVHNQAKHQIAQQLDKAFLSNEDPSHAATASLRESPQKKFNAYPTFKSNITQDSSSQTTAVKPVWQVYALGIWIAGIVLFILLLAKRIAKLRRWHQIQEERQTIPPWFHKILVETAQKFGIERLPAIVFSDQAVTPAVYGLFRPVLLLPESYPDSLSKEEAEHVLLHELAHLKRGDLWLHGITLMLQIVYWFNPLLIWMQKQMKHVREICCDMTIANVLREKTKSYRQTLVNTARELLTESVEPGMGLLGVFEEPFRLVARLRWLEKKTWQNRKLITATVSCIFLFMVACILPMADLETEPEATISEKQEELIPPAEVSPGENFDLNITIKKTESLYAVVLPQLGSPDHFEQAFTHLHELLKQTNITPQGYPFARYFMDSEEGAGEMYTWEIGIPVTKGTKVNPPLEIIHVYNQQVASATVQGIKMTDSIWPQFIEAIKDKGYIPAFPPAVEIWKGESQEKEFWWQTEMQIPVFNLEKGYPNLEVSIKETQSFFAVILPMKGSYGQHPQAQEWLKNYIQQKGIMPTGPYFGMYYSDAAKVPRPLYYWEVGCPVKAGTQVDPPFETRQIESSTVATAVLPGPTEMEYPWPALILQMIIRGYMPAGPALELWHGNSPEFGQDISGTELRIPIIKMEDLGEAMAEWGESFAEEMEKMGTSYADQKSKAATKNEKGTDPKKK
jgi:beta-lactamase regulating signal transducer with metallopeptidase domain/effector-binding domain-containing protein